MAGCPYPASFSCPLMAVFPPRNAAPCREVRRAGREGGEWHAVDIRGLAGSTGAWAGRHLPVAGHGDGWGRLRSTAHTLASAAKRPSAACAPCSFPPTHAPPLRHRRPPCSFPPPRSLPPSLQAAVPTVTSAPKPDLIYDYYGFPPQSYELKYPAPGSPQLAEKVCSLLQVSGLAGGVGSCWGGCLGGCQGGFPGV